MKRVFTTLFSLASICAVVSLTSCSKDPLNHINAEESRVYTTFKDSTANFSSYSTFLIPDSVSVSYNGVSQGKELTDVDAAYVLAVKKYFTNAGYTETTDKSKADIGISVNKIINQSTGYYSYGSFWGGYGGMWNTGYYWGFPGYGYGYPSFMGSYTITDNAISITAIDLKNAAKNQQLNPIWIGTINGYGVVDNSNPNIADSQVDSLFVQSTYLKK